MDETLTINDTPQGQANRWAQEFAAARKEIEPWHSSGDKVVKRYLDTREDSEKDDSRWNLFYQNRSIEFDMMRGYLPRTSVNRTFADANDDVARVSSVILERLLNSDIEKKSDTFAEAAWNVLEDRKLPGGGFLRWRYELKTQGPEGQEVKTWEDAPSDYVHWRDVLWSPARTYNDVRWFAFRAFLSKKQLRARFPDHKNIPLKTKKERESNDTPKASPWGRAEVWEIWDKENERVDWFVEGYGQLLDTKEDPLRLEGFWPMPKPWMANTTTTRYVPTPDYNLVRGLYGELDELCARIKLLQEAIVVRGAYDASNKELGSILSGNKQNRMIPVKGWAALMEKGGLKGAIDWLPLDQVVNAITVLRDVRRELVDQINQLTGMSDLMRGQAADSAKTATASRIESRSASVRIRATQEEFARFCSDALRIKAEIICKHFDPATILARANAQFLPDEDKQHLEAAVALLKDDLSPYRIEVKPESVAMADFDAMKSEGLEVLGVVSQSVQQMGPVLAQFPGGLPFGMKIIQSLLAKLKGGKELEGIFDAAIQALEAQAQNPQQEQPNPQLQVEQLKAQQLQVKGQQEMQKIQAKSQADIAKIQMESQADERKEQMQAEWNVRESAQKAMISQATRPEPTNGVPR